jgi:hypothetical protein
MKVLKILSILLSSLIIGCSQSEPKANIFSSVPVAKTKYFIDSLRYTNQLAAGNNFTARPVLKPNQYYYDERNFFDSSNNLRIYSVIERWDTGDIFTNYYYYQNTLIDVSKRISMAHSHYRSNYYIRNDTLFDSYEEGPLTQIATDTLLIRGYRYLANKEIVGDTSYRKYFGQSTYPPSSMVDLVK